MNTIAERKNGHVYTVSTLTREIKTLLEDRFSFVWVMGEISNYAVPGSGHSYFSLKDTNAVVGCVMFKGQKRSLKFVPENGMKIVGLARMSVYEPRGSYQLIFEHLEPQGSGSMQVAFEQLKNKLSNEGLFDAVHKKQIPFLPRKINVITSPTGAAVRDIIHIATRRFPNCWIEIVPVKVQGMDSDMEICDAIKMVNQHLRSELIILARGGGSMEDLASFNSEIVARAIFESDIPVITGVGHETDFTIADFVADLRAPTPSAAAELALPDKKALIQKIEAVKISLFTAMNHNICFLQQKLDDLYSRLKSPQRVMDEYVLKLRDYETRMLRTVRYQLAYDRDKLSWLQQALDATLPQLEARKKKVCDLVKTMDLGMKNRLGYSKIMITQLLSTLSALNPKSVLDRGYSITRSLPQKKIIMDANDLDSDDQIEIILSKGSVKARVEKKFMVKKKTFEATLKQLEEIVKEMESGDLALEQAVKKYETGIEHAKFCMEILDKTEQKISLLTRDKNDTLREEPFDDI